MDVISWYTVDKWKVILTVLAADGYFPGLAPTFYLVGEWFTTVILFLYFVFPIVKYLLSKKTSAIIAMTLLTVFNLLYILDYVSIWGVVVGGSFSWAVMMFSIGYLFDDSTEKGKLNLIYSIFFLILCIGGCIILSKMEISDAILFSVMGVSIFLFVCKIPIPIGFQTSFIGKIVILVAKYSYFIYLSHHYIIRKVVLLSTTQEYSTLIVLALCVIGTLFFSVTVATIINGINRFMHSGHLGH